MRLLMGFSFLFVTIIGESIADGLGNQCQETLTLNFTDFPQAANPYCNIACSAGGIDTNILDNGIVVCEGETFSIATNGMEDLTLTCNSDDGSSYVYACRILADIYGYGDLSAVTSWRPLGADLTIDPTTFFIDEFGQAPPYFTADSSISPIHPYTGEPSVIRIEGGAVCFNADGSVVDNCTAINEGYENSFIDVMYLPANSDSCTGATAPNCTPPNAGTLNCEE